MRAHEQLNGAALWQVLQLVAEASIIHLEAQCPRLLKNAPQGAPCYVRGTHGMGAVGVGAAGPRNVTDSRRGCTAPPPAPSRPPACAACAACLRGRTAGSTGRLGSAVQRPRLLSGRSEKQPGAAAWRMTDADDLCFTAASASECVRTV